MDQASHGLVASEMIGAVGFYTAINDCSEPGAPTQSHSQTGVAGGGGDLQSRDQEVGLAAAALM